MLRLLKLPVSLLLAAAILPSAGSAVTISFDGLGHGEIYNPTEFVFTADQNGSSFDAGVIFDSNTTDPTTDDDLLFGGGWAGGNIAGEDLGNLLILQESDASCNANLCGDPDDSAAGGSFVFDFGEDLFSALNFVLVDIDDGSQNEQVGSVRLIFREQGQADTVVADRSFDSFASVGFGDRTANRVSLGDLGEASFNVVEINLFSSGAIDELDLTEVPPPIPEPATAGLFGLGLAGLLIAGRRRR